MYEAALALSVVCFVAVIIIFARTDAFSVFHPLTFYCMFHGFVFVFRPIVAYFSDFTLIYQAFQFFPSQSDKLTVILATNLGFLCFAAASLRTGGVAMRFNRDRFTDQERDRLKGAFIWVAAICVPIGVYSLATVWTSAASTGLGYEGMVRDAGTGVFINTTANGYLVEAQLMLATCSAMLAWLFRFRLLALMPLILFVIFRAGTGGRGPFVTALISVGLLYLYEHRKRLPGLRAVILGAVLVATFSVVGDDRGTAIRRAITGDSQSEVFAVQRGGERFLEGMDFANLEYFEYVVYAVPQRSGTYSYFNDVLQVFTEPIPRALWPGKPVGAPFTRIFLFDFGDPVGMTKSLPGQGWFSLGWAGVIIWCSLWGWTLGLIYRRFVESPQNSIKTAVFMMFLPIMLIAYRDGELVTVFRQGLFFIGPLVLWAWLARGIGIPTAQQARAAALRMLRRTDPATIETIPERLDGLEHLPPAARRRRLALEAGGSG
jgi:oligosaccharide repeat unit polymerase